MPKKYIKAKAQPNQPGPGFRTSSNFRTKIFGPKIGPQAKFNPSQFHTQHKGG